MAGLGVLEDRGEGGKHARQRESFRSLAKQKGPVSHALAAGRISWVVSAM